MANFLARIELDIAGPDDYERLYASMRQRGYLREITGEDGVVYQLPTGTYYVTDSSAVLSVALSAAVDAANETGKHASVLVTKWDAARWSGLRES